MWSKLSAKEWFSQTRLRGKWLGNESTIKRCYFSALAELSFKLIQSNMFKYILIQLCVRPLQF